MSAENSVETSAPFPGLLVTRPQPAAQETAELLRARGYPVWCAPLLEITPLPWNMPSAPVAAALVTSGQSVPALADSPLARHTPVYAVGEATASKLRAAGFSAVMSAQGDARTLLALVCQTVSDKSGQIIHFGAQECAFDLTDALRRAGYNAAQQLVLYKSEPPLHLPADTVQALGRKQIRVVLLYSARCAQAFADLGAPWASQLTLLCLSAQVARAAGAQGWAQKIIAAQPREESLLAALRRVK